MSIMVQCSNQSGQMIGIKGIMAGVVEDIVNDSSSRFLALLW